jgi:hypothetical protein
MFDEYAVCKRNSHIRKNHVFYQGEDKYTKCDCDKFLKIFISSFYLFV